MGYDYGAFLEDLAQRESSGQLDKVNDYGYLGLYQMGEAALIDAGYYQPDGTSVNTWEGRMDITSLGSTCSRVKAQVSGNE